MLGNRLLLPGDRILNFTFVGSFLFFLPSDLTQGENPMGILLLSSFVFNLIL